MALLSKCVRQSHTVYCAYFLLYFLLLANHECTSPTLLVYIVALCNPPPIAYLVSGEHCSTQLYNHRYERTISVCGEQRRWYIAVLFCFKYSKQQSNNRVHITNTMTPEIDLIYILYCIVVLSCFSYIRQIDSSRQRGSSPPLVLNIFMHERTREESIII